MRHTNQPSRFLICSLIIVTGPLFAEVKLQVRDGRPIVDGVYVNGHGPYRFLLDTGANSNLIEAGLARKIGMNATLEVDLGSAAGKVHVSGSDGNEIALDSVKADKQEFLYSGLEALHGSSPDLQGVLGQWFLSRFDFTLDLEAKRLDFGAKDYTGTRTPFKWKNARPVISTSLGELALDSGAVRVVLFGVSPVAGTNMHSEMRTVTGSQQVGLVFGKSLVIGGRKIWHGDAVAIPIRSEPEVDGLLPLSLFKTIYICNSESYLGLPAK